ncbi:MAG: CBS domain-containing protein, partial [Pseudomonadales bacterium]|nr:CBS domain-containing protein [Pseudomonadales bacterium]
MTKFDLPELILPVATLRDAMEAIERSSTKIAVVVDDHRQLLGTVTDGNIRRAMLHGVELSAKVDGVMNQSPVFGRVDEPQDQLLEQMHSSRCRQLPLLDPDGRVVRVISQTT